MMKASDIPLADILVSPCIPIEYSLGPNPVSLGMLVTRAAAEVSDDITRNQIKISKRGENAWAIVNSWDNVLNKETGDFVYESIPSERTEEFIKNTHFESMAEAKTFWYEVYLKSLLHTCTHEDSGIRGIWTVLDGQLAVHFWDEDEPVTFEEYQRR